MEFQGPLQFQFPKTFLSEQVEETDPLALSGLQLQGWNGVNTPKNSPYFIYHFSGNLISDGSEVNRSGTFVLIP